MRTPQQQHSKRHHLSAWLLIIASSVSCAADPSAQPATSSTPNNTPTTVTVSEDRPLTQAEKDFYEAIRRNDVAQIKQLIEQGQDPNMAGGPQLPNGKRRAAPLEIAVYGANAQAMDALLKNGADPHFKDINGLSLLAATLGEASTYKRALSNPKRQAPKDQEELKTWLQNYLSIANLLLDHGADANARYDLGKGRYRTALSYAVEVNDFDLVKRLVDLGANVHEPKNTPRAPLFEAAKNANVEIAKVLLEKGALVVTDAELVKDVVHSAVASGLMEFALLPLAYGVTIDAYATAYLSATNPNGIARTAAAASRMHGFQYRHQLLQELIRRGLDVSHHGLFATLPYNDTQTMEILLGAGVDLCDRGTSTSDQTVYEYALTYYRQHQESIDFLKTRGGDHCPPANN